MKLMILINRVTLMQIQAFSYNCLDFSHSIYSNSKYLCCLKLSGKSQSVVNTIFQSESELQFNQTIEVRVKQKEILIITLCAMSHNIPSTYTNTNVSKQNFGEIMLHYTLYSTYSHITKARDRIHSYHSTVKHFLCFMVLDRLLPVEMFMRIL